MEEDIENYSCFIGHPNNIFRKRWSLKIQSALSQVDTRFEFKLRIGHNFVFNMINIQSVPINENFKNF